MTPHRTPILESYSGTLCISLGVCESAVL